MRMIIPLCLGAVNQTEILPASKGQKLIEHSSVHLLIATFSGRQAGSRSLSKGALPLPATRRGQCMGSSRGHDTRDSPEQQGSRSRRSHGLIATKYCAPRQRRPASTKQFTTAPFVTRSFRHTKSQTSSRKVLTQSLPPPHRHHSFPASGKIWSSPTVTVGDLRPPMLRPRNSHQQVREGAGRGVRRLGVRSGDMLIANFMTRRVTRSADDFDQP